MGSKLSHLDPIGHGLEAVHGGPHVQLREPVAAGLHVAVVVVDDVADVGAAAVDDPVVSVEGQLEIGRKDS